MGRAALCGPDAHGQRPLALPASGTNPLDEAIAARVQMMQRGEDGVIDGYGLYKRTAGEVEARATQARRDLTADQRRARPPWLDYDVSESDQIVRY